MKTRPVANVVTAFLVLTLLMAFVTQLSAQDGATLITSTFDQDTEGWTVLGNAAGPGEISFPTWGGSGGAPGGTTGGNIQMTDAIPSKVWYWVAPAPYLGAKSAYYGRTLTFFLRQSETEEQFAVRDVIMEGEGISLEYRFAANPGTEWTRYEIPLIAGAGWTARLSGTTERRPATEAEMQNALRKVTDLRIRGEFRNQGPDTGNLDNVVLGGAFTGTVPTPTATTPATTPTTPAVSPTATTPPTGLQNAVYLPLVRR